MSKFNVITAFISPCTEVSFLCELDWGLRAGTVYVCYVLFLILTVEKDEREV
jgi:hypothetical protein